MQDQGPTRAPHSFVSSARSAAPGELPQDKSARAKRAAPKLLKAAQKRFSKAKQLLRTNPWVLILPALTLVALTIGGCFGVHEAIQSSEAAARSTALWSVTAAVESLQLELARAFITLRQIQSVIQRETNLNFASILWERFAGIYWEGVPEGTLSLILTFQGYQHRTINSPEFAKFAAPDGTDYLALDSPYRPLGLTFISSKSVSVVGPIDTPGLGRTLVFGCSIIIRNVSENETFGSRLRPTACPPGVCYDRATRSKMWGAVGIQVDPDRLLYYSPALNQLRLTYEVELWQPGDIGRYTAADEGEENDQSGSAVCAPLRVANQEWSLCIWREKWEDSWLWWMYAVVAVGSILIAGLLCSVLIMAAEHKTLLHSVLPKEAIERIRAETDWSHKGDRTELFNTMHLETPATLMLGVIKSNLEGKLPLVATLLAVRDALQRSADVYRPTAEGLKTQMEEAKNLDAEVRRALFDQLLGKAREDSSNGDSADDERPANWEADLATIFTEMNGSLSSAEIDTEMVYAEPSGTKGPDDSNWIVYSNIGSVISYLVSNAQTDVTGLRVGSNGCDTRSFGSQRGPKPSRASLLMELPGIPELDVILATVDAWQFDAYALQAATNGHPLSVLGFWLLSKSGLVSWAHMETSKLVRFLQRIEAGYKDNPYHNSRHAADVLQSLHVIMTRGGLMPGYVDQTTMLAAYLAAIVHDYEHRGRNNDFLINTHHDLAVQFNDRSPMENHHLAAAFALLKQSEYNFLENVPKAAWKRIRATMIDLVLATDMKQHFTVLSQYEALHGDKDTIGSKDNKRSRSRRSSICESGSENFSGQSRTALEPVSDNDRILSLQMALKCADLGHLAAPLDVHLKWVRALEAEFFQQGDEERAAGLPISPLCDRSKEGVTKSQVGFLSFVVLPLFRALTSRFQACTPMLRAVTANHQYWVTQETNSENDSNTPTPTKEALEGSEAISKLRESTGSRLKDSLKDTPT